MKLARAITLVALGLVDVRVRAAAPVYDATDKRTTFTVDHARFVLAKGGLATAEGPAIRLVEGRALALAGLTVVTPYGRVSCDGACEALFTRTEHTLKIETLTEGWTLVRAGESAARAIPAAVVVEVGGITPGGLASVTAPASIPWDELVRDWARLWPDGPEKFTARVRAFRGDWDRAVDEVSARDHDRALAMIESEAAADARRAARARAAAAEDARLRQLFREKNYVE